MRTQCGISRDMRGIPVLEIPPRYMSADASDDEKAVYEYYKSMIRNLHKNEQTGIIIPNQYDPDSKQAMFKFSLLGVGGQKTFDTNAIISRWNNAILTALFADVLKMGQEQVGSFSLAGTKTNILSMAIEHRLKEIQTVLNQDLMVQLHQLNGWSMEHLPSFQYDDLEEVDMDVFSKFVQRVFSVNAMEFDREAANRIRKVMGIPLKPEDEDINEDQLTENRSRSGDGGATPGPGTSTGPLPSDTNISNTEAE